MNLGEAVKLGKNLPGGDNYSWGGRVGSKQEDNENIKASKEVVSPESMRENVASDKAESMHQSRT